MESLYDIREILQLKSGQSVELRIIHIAKLWYVDILGKKTAPYIFPVIDEFFPDLILRSAGYGKGESEITEDFYIKAYQKKDGEFSPGPTSKAYDAVRALVGSNSGRYEEEAQNIQKRVAEELYKNEENIIQKLRTHYEGLIKKLDTAQKIKFSGLFKKYLNDVAEVMKKSPKGQVVLFPFEPNELFLAFNNDYLGKLLSFTDDRAYADFFLWMNLAALLRNEIGLLVGRYDLSFEFVNNVETPVRNLLLKVKERLEQEKVNHPSFRLMYETSGLDTHLIPKGFLQIPVSRRMAQLDDTGRNRSDRLVISELAEFIKESWSAGKQKHITIEGEGGIGKTVALLSLSSEPGVFPEDVPVIYVPLHRLNSMRYEEGQGMNRLDWFIRSYLKEGCRCSEEEAAAFYKLCDHDMEGCFQVVLLLDGYNEVLDSLKGQVKTAIIEWADKPGVQIVTTSRTAWSCGDDFMKIKLQPLGQDAIRGYLDRAGAKIPPPGDNLWRIISFPMMLTLYAYVDIIQKHMGAGMFPEEMDMGHLKWHQMNKAGDIIWNYLQTELARRAQASGGRPDIIYGDYAVAILHTAPYIAWKMSRAGYYYIPVDEDDTGDPMESLSFMDLVIESITYLKESGEWVAQLKNFVSSRDKRRWRNMASSPESEECLDRADRIGNILLNEVNLFRIQEVNAISSSAGISRTAMVCMMHQQFRDGLAAVWLCQRIETMENYSDAEEGIYSRTGDTFALPICWRESLGRYVLKFAAEIMDDALAARFWEAGRVYQPSYIKYAYTMLNFMSERSIEDGKHQNDFRGLDFSGMDLREISLYPYRKEGSLKLRLPGKGDAGKMEQAKISTATFQSMGHSGEVLSISISGDGKRAVSCGLGDADIRVWNLQNMFCEKILKGHKDVQRVSISSSGKLAASTGYLGEGVYVWNLDTMTHETVLFDSSDEHFNSFDNICISDDCILITDFWSDCHVSSGIRIIGSSLIQKRILIYDIAQLRDDSKIIIPIGLQEYGNVTSVSMSNDGKNAVSGLLDGSVLLWNLENLASKNTRERLLKEKGFKVLSVSISGDGKHAVAVSSDNFIYVWNLENRSYERVRIHDINPTCVTISADGKYALCGGTVGHLLNLEKMTEIKVVDNNDPHMHSGYWIHNHVNCVSISSDGKRGVFGMQDGGVQVWDLGNMIREKTFEGSVYKLECFAVSGDGNRAVIGMSDGSVRVWNLEKMTCEAVLEGHTESVNKVYITYDGKRAASYSGWDENLRIWNLENMFCESMLTDMGLLSHFSINSNGTRAIIEVEDKGIYIWNIESLTNKKLSVCKTAAWKNVFSLSNDGRYVVYVIDEPMVEICIWNLESMICERVRVGKKGDIEDISISHEGKYAAWIQKGAEDVIHVWDLEQMIYKKVLVGHLDACWRNVYISDEKRILFVVSRLNNTEYFVWNLESMECETKFDGYGDEIWHDISSNGKIVLSLSKDENNIHVWNLENKNQAEVLRVLPGIDIVGMSSCGADYSSGDTRELLRQNGAIT